MKKIIKPSSREEAVYYSDFSGKLFDYNLPVELSISCGYESKYDGSEIALHLDDEDLEKVLSILKTLVSENFKKSVLEKNKKFEKNYEDSMQMRDWDYCDRLLNGRDLLNKLV